MADSMAIKVMIMGTGIYVAFMIVFTYVLNAVFGGYDSLLALNMISSETSQHINMMVDVWKLSPAIFLVGLIWWVIERAKGTNITPGLFYMYEGVLLLGILYSFIMLITIAPAVDILQVCLFSDQLVLMTDPALLVGSAKLFALGVKLVYSYCMWPGYVACVLYILHPNILQLDTMFSSAPQEDTTTEYTTQWENM